MAASRYKRAWQIVEKWPLDPSKGERRDIGLLLRNRVAYAFKRHEQNEVEEPEKCDKMLESLENIVADKYKNQYHYAQNVGAMGLNFEDIHGIVSEETLEAYERSARSPLSAMKDYFSHLKNKFLGTRQEMNVKEVEGVKSKTVKHLEGGKK